MRVGYGAAPASERDLIPETEPPRLRGEGQRVRGMVLRCRPTGRSSGPAASSPGASRPAPHRLAPVPSRSSLLLPIPVPAPTSPAAVIAPPSPWSPLRGVAPPLLAKDQVGWDAGTESAVPVPARLYVWGEPGDAWRSTAQWLSRFDDPFSLSGVHSSARSPAPFADEGQVADLLGLGGTTATFGVVLDPSGSAAVLVSRRGLGRAELFGVAQGEPVVRFHDESGSGLPEPISAVRVGSVWWLLTPRPGAGISRGLLLYRVEAGKAVAIAHFPRVPLPSGEWLPRLVRRSRGDGLGLLLLGVPTYGSAERDWHVVPIDEDTGALGEPVKLGANDFAGIAPAPCASEDGWLADLAAALPPAIAVGTPEPPAFGSIQWRVRMGPGWACTEALSAHVDSMPRSLRGGAPPAAADRSKAPPLPLFVTEWGTGARWELSCDR